MEEITAEDLRRIYQDSTISREDTAQHFGVSIHRLCRLLAIYGIKKSPEARSAMSAPNLAKAAKARRTAAEEKISREVLEALYLDECLPAGDIVARLGITRQELTRALRLYGLKHSPEQISTARSRALKAARQGEKVRMITPEQREKLRDAGVKGNAAKVKLRDEQLSSQGITRKSVHQYFIVENHTLEECAEHFSMPYSTFRKLLRRWDIAKTQKDAAMRGRATSIERYGEEFHRSRFSKVDRRAAQAKGVESKRRNTQARLNAAGITREYLEEEYLTNNRSFASLAEEFSMSKGRMRTILNNYNLVKDPAMAETSRLRGMGKFYEDEERVRDAVTRTQGTIRERYGMKWYRDNASKSEGELLSALEEQFPDLTITSGTYSVIRSPLTGAALQLDIYIPELLLAMEFNGEYWHDKAAWERDVTEGTTESKEALKTHLCGEKGILLHHLWDGEFKEDKTQFLANAIALVEDRMKEINHV